MNELNIVTILSTINLICYHSNEYNTKSSSVLFFPDLYNTPNRTKEFVTNA